MKAEQIKDFLERFSKDAYTREEHQAFIDWLKTADRKEVESLVEEYQIIAENKSFPNNINYQLNEKIEAALDQWEFEFSNPEIKKFPTRIITQWRTIAVAAVVITLAGIGIWLFSQPESGQVRNSMAKKKNLDIPAPETTHAMITLADGRKIYLDSAGTGTLVMQQNTNVIKNEKGEIVYQSTGNGLQDAVTYNTLFNPRGSRVIAITLSDGTKVWLNSESSLRYPTAFTGNTREVELTGEGYFEVAKNEKKSFHAKVNEIDVQVLGTHFNINGYYEDPFVNITLLEGRVHVTKDGASTYLRPGEQAKAGNDGIKVTSDIDIDQVMAWQRGFFEFNKTDLPTIMRQISRWYDVEIIYEGKPSNKRFGGGLSRNLPLTGALELLEAYGVEFRLEGKKLVVIP